MPKIPKSLGTSDRQVQQGLIRTSFLIGRPDGPFYSGVKMDPTDLGPGTATWLGGTGTILLGGFLWLRKFLSRDATDRAMDNADIGTVRRLNELLDSERLARKEAEARADQFAKERNELAAAVGRMEGKIEALTSQVSQLTEKVTTQSAEIARLRAQLGGIN
ncbi:Prophage PssSM-02, Orf39 [Pseudomonas syringae]|nr:Prophage PssSM-02, Orf39 [Pseudomonas syringae]